MDGGEKAILDRMLGVDAEGLRGVRAKIKAMMPPFAWNRFNGPDTSMFDPLIDQDMLRAVVVDLERLAGGNTTETRQNEDADPASLDTTTGCSGMSDGGYLLLTLEGSIIDGKREVECLRAICEHHDLSDFEDGVRYLMLALRTSLKEIGEQFYELHDLLPASKHWQQMKRGG